MKTRYDGENGNHRNQICNVDFKGSKSKEQTYFTVKLFVGIGNLL